ncbi:MAG: FtsX-like permease family protein [Succinivibrio sp.]
MLFSLSLNLAVKFLNSKRYGALARFISLASTSGIGVGVCAIILGLSVMNGFEHELNNRVLSLIPAASVHSMEKSGFEDVNGQIEILKKNPHVSAASAAVSLNGAFSHEQTFAPALVTGIDLVHEKDVVNLDRFMDCDLQDLHSDSDQKNVILGNSIAKKLNVKKGDLVDLRAIDALGNSEGLSSVIVKPFKVVGIFKTGGQIDSALAFIDIKDALELRRLKAPDTIHVKVDNMLEVTDIMEVSFYMLTQRCTISTWIQSQGKLYNDINMIRSIMYLAMFLVISVASFNIVSNLIMAVSEKKKEIAILLTMGAKRSLIIRAFTLMGMLSSLKGCFFGTVFGCILACSVPSFTIYLKDRFGIELLNENVYFINFVPSILEYTDVLIVVSFAVLMSFIASVYPAIRASRVNPANEIGADS